jgi:hypothetical protein
LHSHIFLENLAVFVRLSAIAYILKDQAGPPIFAGRPGGKNIASLIPSTLRR